jgi:PKD repeat protein
MAFSAPDVHLRRIAVLCLTVLAVMFTLSWPTIAESVKADSINWCGTQKRFELDMRERGIDPAAAAVYTCPGYGLCDTPEIRDAWTPNESTQIAYIRLAIHSRANSDGSSPFTSEVEARNAVDHLNQLFLPSRIQFDFIFDQVNSTEWRLLGEDEIDAMKNASAKDPAHWLNVWVGNVEFAYSFGTFPFSSNALEATGGVVLGHFHWGGNFSSFAHEIGHCLGLWHTFHGVNEVTACSACYESVDAPQRDLLGDLCSDTPPSPVWYVCDNAAGSDSCSGLAWGETQPENLMGYTPSSCRSLFTPQQQARMQCWTDAVLSGWISGVLIEGDTIFGKAPLAVELSGQTFRSVNSWLWNLGDGTTAATQTVTHTYNQPGMYTVGVDINTPNGVYSDSRPELIWVHDDTLAVSNLAAYPDRSIRVNINLHNYVPVSEIDLPIVWSAENNLRFDSISTVGLRGADFETQTLLQVDNTLRGVTLQLIPSLDGVSRLLMPGQGPIVALFFTSLSQITDTTSIAVSAYEGSFEPYLACPLSSYTPTFVSGAVYPGGCCTGRVGDVNGEGGDEPTISDVSSLIDMLFLSGVPVQCLTEADINQSGGTAPDADDITIGDISLLIDYLFITGPARGLLNCF